MKISATHRGICDDQGPECAIGLAAAGIQGPYYGTTKTYSMKCLISGGFAGIGSEAVSDHMAEKSENFAMAAAAKATGSE